MIQFDKKTIEDWESRHVAYIHIMRVHAGCSGNEIRIVEQDRLDPALITIEMKGSSILCM